MKKVILFVMLWTVLSVGQAFSQIPNELYYESYYQENGSNVNGNIELVIRIYTNATVGEYLYEDSNTVTVVNGSFSTRIGDNTTVGSLSNALASGHAYLDITINGTNLPPREQILSEAYALKAAAVPDNAITASMIADNAIQSRHIANGVVGEDQLAADAVTSDKLVVGAVASDKLAADVWVTNDERYVNIAGDTMTGDLVVNSNLTVKMNATIGGGFTNPVKFISRSGSLYAVFDPTGQGGFFMGPQMPGQTGSLYSLNLGFRDSGTLIQSLTYKGGLNLGVVGPDGGVLCQSNQGYLGFNIGYGGGWGGTSGKQILDLNTDVYNNNESLGFNLGNFSRDTQATQYNRGGLNYGYFVAFGGRGSLQYNDNNAVNIGYFCDGGYQKAQGSQGSFNLGMLHSYDFKGAGNVEQGLYNSWGSFNMGYLGSASATKAKQIVSNAHGGINFGYVRGGSQVVTGNGSGNFGCLDIGEYQVTAGKGSFSWGSKNSNLYNYAYAFGFGVNTYETNSLSARRFWEGGVPLDQKYATTSSLGTKLDVSGGVMTGPLTLQSNLVVNGYATLLKIVPQGDISMGTYTNGL